MISQGTSATAPGTELSVEETLQEESADGPHQGGFGAEPEEVDAVDAADKVDDNDVADKVIGDEIVDAPGEAEGAGEAGGGGDFGFNNVTSDSDDTEVSHFLPNKKVNLVKVAKIGALGPLPEEP